MSRPVLHMAGQTWHGRKGAIRNAFRYSVDYVLVDAEADLATPALFGRNASALMSLWDSDHGGAPGQGKGAAWVREVLAAHQLPPPARIDLLAQPRLLGHVFNPVSFWLCYSASDDLFAVIAEVTNTFGDRHSYLCHHADQTPIGASDRLRAQKIFHVSPFQPVGGGYEFRFDIRDNRIGIWIDYSRSDAEGGVMATLTGHLAPLGSGRILRAGLRRPFGSRRVLVLIHWQALKLWLKGALYRPRPEAPSQEVSR